MTTRWSARCHATYTYSRAKTTKKLWMEPGERFIEKEAAQRTKAQKFKRLKKIHNAPGGHLGAGDPGNRSPVIYHPAIYSPAG